MTIRFNILNGWHPLRVSHDGDTIIEVLISVTIISLVLVGAYGTTNRSLDAMQDTQEHSEALQIANSQVELLRAHNGLDSSDSCFNDSDAPEQAGGQACAFTGTTANNCPTTNTFCYEVAITQTDSVPTYKVDVSWGSLLGGKDNVALFYQLPVATGGTGGAPSGGDADYGFDETGGNGDLCSVSDPTTWDNDYCFQLTFTNQSVNTPGIILTGCTWDWGDGTSQDFSAGATDCTPGGSTWHQYARQPYSQGIKSYTATLTNHYSNAPDKSYSIPGGVNLPW